MASPSRAGARGAARRAKLIIGLLLLMVALTGVLTYQAQDAARSHRATAERALRSYTAIAAFTLYTSSQQVLFDVIRLRTDTVRLKLYHTPRIAQLAGSPEGEACHCMDSPPGRVRFALVGQSRALVSDERLPASLQTWLRDSLPTHAIGNAASSWGVGLAFPRGSGRAVVFARHARPDPRFPQIYGYVAPARDPEETYRGILQVFPLLPMTLLDRHRNEALLSAEVFTPGGDPVYSSPRIYPASFSAADTLPPIFGSLVQRISLRPEAAGLLVVGGVPHTRLPLLFGLLALTIALVVVAVQQLRREAELARMREDFVSSVSHELRTPLAQIRMFTETLLLGRTRTEAERRRSLEIIDQEARRLTHLVENVLRMSRSARGVSQVAPETVELSKEVASIVESFRMFATQKKAELRLEVTERVVGSADRGGLRQMLLNLLDNALKYGPVGQRVTVGLAVFGDSARLWVDDEGPGIAATDLEKVFSPFYRSPRDAGSAVAGSGIGLAVVREIATAHGGRAWAEAAPGGGARITIEIPGAHVQAPADWVAA